MHDTAALRIEYHSFFFFLFLQLKCLKFQVPMDTDPNVAQVTLRSIWRFAVHESKLWLHRWICVHFASIDFVHISRQRRELVLWVPSHCWQKLNTYNNIHLYY